MRARGAARGAAARARTGRDGTGEEQRTHLPANINVFGALAGQRGGGGAGSGPEQHKIQDETSAALASP
jgi:hypothetical protein